MWYGIGIAYIVLVAGNFLSSKVLMNQNTVVTKWIILPKVQIFRTAHNTQNKSGFIQKCSNNVPEQLPHQDRLWQKHKLTQLPEYKMNLKKRCWNLCGSCVYDLSFMRKLASQEKKQGTKWYVSFVTVSSTPFGHMYLSP